ncbi:MAG: BMP family ABC transporter substrate-binding protein [Spirochaetes bacterium]|jgi:basic membrane lipoprotein Med (substrate-binding protein (PBP1-ABC) superfamily)|nr:BMP family ABC transporter substrate-binding protein [Spirochaetota bacterium]
MKHALLVVGCLLVLGAVAFAGGEQEAAEDGQFRMAAVYQTAIEEPWDGAIHQAALKAEEELDISYEFTEQVAAADFEKVLREYAERGFDLIIGDAFLAGEEPSRRVAKDYPDTAFAFGSEFGPAEPNYSVFDNWIHEPSYLMGVIAGHMTETNVLGVVAAIPINEVNRLVNAFHEGALSVNEDVELEITYIGSWFDPPKAKEAALAQIEAGADLIFAERFGVFEAARENDVYAFGNMTDQNELAPNTVITSAVWNMYPTIEYLVNQVRADAYVAQDLKDWSMMAKGGAELAPYHGMADVVPEEAKQQVAELEEQILNGTFRVPIIEEEPETN